MKQSNLVKIFKALSNEQRLKLFMMIYNHHSKAADKLSKCHTECCGGMEKAFTKACDCLDLSRSTISHHFKELVNSGLIKSHRQGQSFYCEVNEEAVTAIKDFLK